MMKHMEYTPMTGCTICDLMGNGQSLHSICAGDSMPDEATVRMWARNNVDGFQMDFTIATELLVRSYKRDAQEITDDLTAGRITSEEEIKLAERDVVVLTELARRADLERYGVKYAENSNNDMESA